MENKKQKAAYKREAAKKKSKREELEELVALFRPVSKKILRGLQKYHKENPNTSDMEWNRLFEVAVKEHIKNGLTVIRGKGNKKENLKPVLPIKVRREHKDDNR